jgi:hypothetical protein
MSRRFCVFAVAALGLVSGSGCQQLGAIAYFLRPPVETVKAVYTLPSGSVLVLVDDDQGLVRSPTVKSAVVDALARELKAHKISEKVTTNEELARMRQAEPNFDQRGARELGRMAEADTVLLLSTQAFAMDDELEMASSPAKFAVTVRVIDAKAETKDKVRLWPSETSEREGHLVEGVLQAHELRNIKTLPEAQERLAATLAAEVAKLFYDRKEAAQ